MQKLLIPASAGIEFDVKFNDPAAIYLLAAESVDSGRALQKLDRLLAAAC